MNVRPIPLLIVLCGALTLSMAGFANFAVLLPEFSQLWSLSSTQAGWISGIYFVGYVAAVPLLVGLTDTVDAKKIYLWGTLVGVIGSFGFALFADGFWSAMLFRFLAGVSLAGTYMPGLQILSNRLDPSWRQRAVPWYTSSFGIGSGFSYYYSGQMAEHMEWPLIFQFAGLMQVLCVVLILIAVVPRQPSGTVGERHPLDFRPVFSNRSAMAYILGYVGHSYELFAFRAWIVAFLVFAALAANADVSRSDIALYVTIYSLIGMPASIIGAYLAESRDRSRVLSVITATSFVVGAVYGFLAGQPLVWVVVIGGLYSVIIMSDSAAFTAGTVKMARPGERGATLAVHSVCGFSGGFLGPLLVGTVLDVAGGQGSYMAWGLAGLTMGAGSLAALVGIRVMLYLAQKPRYEK